MADLTWHLTEVQDFWTYIIANRPAGPENYERLERASGGRLVSNLRAATTGLLTALEPCSPDETAWSWAPEQTVGFTMRRQVHEALTHCIDGLIANGHELPQISPELAADGVDEMVHVMLAETQDSPTSDGEILLQTSDTDDQWTLALGQGSCSISGTSLDLNLWLWGRGDSLPLTVTGDATQVGRLRETIAAKTE